MRYTGKQVQQHMHATEGALWWCLIICTCGLAYPFYRHRKNRLARTEKLYG